MYDSPDPDETTALPPEPADSLDAGLAAGFGRPADRPMSLLSHLRTTIGPIRPVLLRDAESESTLVVKPKSDAMPTAEQAGDRYQISGEIARGGMGAILRGRDVDIGRDLAVKVLLEKFANRPEVARRFIEEAQIGGQLQHPGVVPVYDIGRFGDRPYFTMKLVKGQTLAAILADRSDPTAERPRLLAIALQVTQTLAYAHAKGVIHRDLKPANIMVGAFGEVQVMDWGLAKVLASGGIADEEQASRGHRLREDETTIRTARNDGSILGTDTEAGSMLGTPAYIPPEQANGDVALMDRRTDVFGLGAILCEILTGKPPYVGRSGEEVRRKAANGDLAEALARLGACGADRELIALTGHCLAPEPVDRPKDAQAVSDALTSYLDGVQDRLRRSELAEAEARAKAIEEAKRRRLTVALAATILLALTLGGGGWLWVRGEREARQVALSRDVNDALSRATVLGERAKEATLGASALLAQAREQVQRALALVENSPADPELVARVRRLQAELDQEEKDRTLVAALEAARLAQAETRSELNRFAIERAVPVFREAFRAYGLAAGEGKPDEAARQIRMRPSPVREAIIDALDEWDDLAGNAKLALPEPHREWLQAVLEAAEPDGGWNHQVRAARRETDQSKRMTALEALAESADARKLPARSLTRLALQLRPSQAETLLRRAQQQYPADFWVNQNLGIVLWGVKPPRWEDSVRFLTVAVALRPESPGSLVNLGFALNDRGQIDEAVASYRKAIELDPKYAAAYSNMGNTLRRKGQVDEAISACRKAIELDPTFVFAHNNLAIALIDKGQVDEAIASYRKAIELNPKYFRAHHKLGNALWVKGRIEDAIASYRKAIEIDPKFAFAHNDLAIALRDKGQLDEAIDSFREAIEHDSKYAMAHSNLGNALKVKGQINEAIDSHRKAIELDPKFTSAHNDLGVALMDKGEVDEAIAFYRKAIKLNPKYAMAYSNLGGAQRVKGQVDEAITACRKAIELDPTLGLARSNLVRAERMQVGRDKFPDFQTGRFKPSSSAERFNLIEWCRFKKFNRAAAGLYSDAFTADPGLADDLKAFHRYNAACFAALAAAGRGEDAAGLDDIERARWRFQALEWLRADLDAYAQHIGNGPPTARAEAVRQLIFWKQDSELAGIRDDSVVFSLTDEERASITRLWDDVARLLVRAEAIK